MQTYEELLARAMEKVPKGAGTGERFEMPAADIALQGNQTIFKNFSVVAEKLRREPKHLLKFLSKELAIPGAIDGGRALFDTKLQAAAVQKKLESYVKEFIICKSCGRPDTKLVTENRIAMAKCEACGARNSVREI
ncbi:MAG TPA: translation initiation factor IF-2 subunit beta [archaeon]|nr:translation initiation factor IF-2 subunit beta [archaeon]